jgi:hypothetical protein
MSAGLLANAALITTIGFVSSAARCKPVLAVQGLSCAEGRNDRGAAALLKDYRWHGHYRPWYVLMFTHPGHQPARPDLDGMVLNGYLQPAAVQGFTMAATPINPIWCFVGCSWHGHWRVARHRAGGCRQLLPITVKVEPRRR